MIRQCELIAIEGAHGSGKTTLVHGVIAQLKSQSIAAEACFDTARSNPFIEAARIHGQDEIDVFAELSLLGEMLARDAQLARHYDVLVVDKTVASVLGYARVILPGTDLNSRLLEGVFRLCSSYSPVYDKVFYLSDRYELGGTADRYRPTEVSFQVRADLSIRATCAELGIALTEVPLGLSRDEKEGFILSQLNLGAGAA